LFYGCTCIFLLSDVPPVLLHMQDLENFPFLIVMNGESKRNSKEVQPDLSSLQICSLL